MFSAWNDPVGKSDTIEKMSPAVTPTRTNVRPSASCFRAKVVGLNDYPEDLQPPVELVYYAYHIMVGLGTIFIAVMAIAAFLLWRGALDRSRWFLWILMLAIPFPYIANQAGWIVAEVGRQPWAVYGLQKTADAISPNVSAGMTTFTLLGFMGLYALVGLLYLYLFGRIINRGPADTSEGAHAAPVPAEVHR